MEKFVILIILLISSVSLSFGQDQIPDTPLFILFEKQSWDGDVRYTPKAFATIEDVRSYLEKTDKDEIIARMYVAATYYPVEFIQTIPVAKEIVIEIKREWKFLPPVQLR